MSASSETQQEYSSTVQKSRSELKRYAGIEVRRNKIIYTFRSGRNARDAFETMVDLEKFVERNNTSFYELLTLLERDEAFIMRLKSQDRPTGVA